ncbi:helix-turn-helix domain-containing protein [Vagococcus sp. BWB3-3]|uniref:Helix-turn-helix domain-containing protein n=1 Tax=Vagococcus allomyrinae TaxID=2794353 RepID=A0A940SXJ8_9ENTE|nr:helix-turn-helix domain-containing protein [Vagococcus allomyrinae]MBP1042448.1 helix-turn-helix domain-containing protein [Vagococcus allomyrinae]
MINLLSKQDRRYLKILEVLFDNKLTTLTSLMTMLNNSRHTIREDFDAINVFIEPMSIVTSQHGFSLEYPLDINRDYLYSCILSNSLEYSFLEMIFFEKEERLEDYAEALFTSVSTLRRIIKEINAHTKQYHFSIKTDPLQLVGDERSISNVMINFFREKYPKSNYPFSKVEQQLLNKLIDYSLRDRQQFNNLPDLKFLQLNLLISLVRMQKNHLRTLDKTTAIPHYSTDFLNDIYFKKSFENTFKIELNEANLKQLFFPFIYRQFAFSYEHALEIAQNSPDKAQLLNDIDQYLKIATEKFGFDLTTNTGAFTLEIFNLHALMIGDNYLLYDREKIFIDNIKKRSSVLAYFYEENSSLILKHFKNFGKKDVSRFLYYLTTHLEGMYNQFYGHQPVSKVGVFMNLDIEHTQFIRNFLEHTDVGHFEFYSIMTNDLEDAFEQFSQFDVVVTNLSNLNHDDVCIITIDLFPTKEDFKKLNDCYFKLNPLPNQPG